MNFTTLTFIPFLLLVIFLYYTAFRKCQWVLLLVASIAFYLFSGPKYIVFILVTATSTYLLAGRIQFLHDEEKRIIAESDFAKDEKKAFKKKYTGKRKRLLLLDFLINLGLLCVIKYTDFALTGVSALLKNFGLNWSKEFNFVLPLGISFYTFMSIGYILDIYWKRYKAETNVFKFATFVTYFPHIVQGPIGRYNKLSEQFVQKHKFDYDKVTKGAQLILWGYFEKMVIADRLAIFVNGVNAKWDQLTGIPLILSISVYSIQLYMDWMGCMDIARGASEMLGIHLERNFWHPYFSKDMPEFWRRWHISLGNWFKDYLLYPVSMSGLCKKINRTTRKKWGNQASRAFSAVVPAACVWIATGLWHGAAMCFLLWGIYHGILIILSSSLEVPIQKLNKFLHINTECFSFNLFRMARTFLLCCIGRLFFLASDGFGQAIAMIKRTFDFSNLGLHTLWDESLYNFGLDRRGFMLSVILIVLVWAVSMLQEKFDKDGKTIRDVVAEQNIVFRWALYLGAFAGILILGIYGSGYNASAFVYGQF